jgi:hypothetical protein
MTELSDEVPERPEPTETEPEYRDDGDAPATPSEPAGPVIEGVDQDDEAPAEPEGAK